MHGDHASPPFADLLDRLDEMAPALRSAAEAADRDGSPTSDPWRLLRATGLTTAVLPTALGGQGLMEPDAAPALFAVLRRLGAVDLVQARLFEGHANAVLLVLRHGTAAQQEALARSIRDGAMSAVWGADDARRLTATGVDGQVRLSGRKVLASGAGLVQRPLVTAATPDGPLMLLLDLPTGTRADLSTWTAQGMRASATGIIDLDGLILHREAVIGPPGAFLRQPGLSGGAWRFCAAHLGAAEALLDLFREHLLARNRGEDPYQLQRLATCAAALGSAAFWIAEAARRAAPPDAAPDVSAFVNLTRMVTERAALDVLEAVHRGAGLAGFLRPHPIERITRDLSTYLRQPVPDLAMADAGRAVLASPHPMIRLWESA